MESRILKPVLRLCGIVPVVSLWAFHRARILSVPAGTGRRARSPITQWSIFWYGTFLPDPALSRRPLPIGGIAVPLAHAAA